MYTSVSLATQARASRRRQEDRRAQTRAKVLKAAGRVFAARGYHGAKLDEVAEAAGLSKGAVYYNFGSKEGLFLSLLEDRYRAQLAEVSRTLEAGAGVKSTSAASDMLHRLGRDPRWPPLFFEFVAYAARDAKTRERFASWMRDSRAALAELVEVRAQQLGVEPVLPADQLAVAVSALANGMLIEALFEPEGTSVEAFDDYVCLLLSGRTGP